MEKVVLITFFECKISFFFFSSYQESFDYFIDIVNGEFHLETQVIGTSSSRFIPGDSS